MKIYSDISSITRMKELGKEYGLPFLFSFRLSRLSSHVPENHIQKLSRLFLQEAGYKKVNGSQLLNKPILAKKKVMQQSSSTSSGVVFSLFVILYNFCWFGEHFLIIFNIQSFVYFYRRCNPDLNQIKSLSKCK